MRELYVTMSRMVDLAIVSADHAEMLGLDDLSRRLNRLVAEGSRTIIETWGTESPEPDK